MSFLVKASVCIRCKKSKEREGASIKKGNILKLNNQSYEKCGISPVIGREDRLPEPIRP